MSRHQILRLRHDTRVRTLTVQRIRDLNPRMRRIEFHSDDLTDFISASPDDHIKLFFSNSGPNGDERVMRDYTPRKIDKAAGTMLIDFALHEAGPATQWAMKAEIGSQIDIGGPRGSGVVPDDFDWYLLIGDETALPAIGRRVEELREGVPVITVGIIAEAGDEQEFGGKADWRPLWVHRAVGEPNEAKLVIKALDKAWEGKKALIPDHGEGFIFIAGETSVSRKLRAYVTEKRGHPSAWLKAAGYWTRGEADAHGPIKD